MRQGPIEWVSRRHSGAMKGGRAVAIQFQTLEADAPGLGFECPRIAAGEMQFAQAELDGNFQETDAGDIKTPAANLPEDRVPLPRVFPAPAGPRAAYAYPADSSPAEELRLAHFPLFFINAICHAPLESAQSTTARDPFPIGDEHGHRLTVPGNYDGFPRLGAMDEFRKLGFGIVDIYGFHG